MENQNNSQEVVLEVSQKSSFSRLQISDFGAFVSVGAIRWLIAGRGPL